MSAAQVHVRRMLDRIEQNYAEPITLHSLAIELHRQSAYLGAVFRREVGVSMREWLTSVRLAHASELIREGTKVEAVSLLVGYRSKKNFYRRFKRRFGTTPFGHASACRGGTTASAADVQVATAGPDHEPATEGAAAAACGDDTENGHTTGSG
jgi:AraC-like DNA-binding protein